MPTPASSVYGARLKVRGRLPTPLLVPLVLMRRAFLGYWGFGSDRVAPASIEVFRLSDGVRVSEIPVGRHYDDQADRLAETRNALEALTAEESLAQWERGDS